MNKIHIMYLAISILLLSGCAIVRPGEAGIKTTLGKVDDKVLVQGPKLYFPFTSRVIKLPVRTENIEIAVDLPSKEGLTIRSDISILYRLETESVVKVYQDVGLNYEQTIILPIFRSAASDVSAQFFAKDMHSGERASIERRIQTLMTERLEGRGIIIESVLMKSIKLPDGLSRAIEDKLEAEQRAQQMQFILDRERQEAQRKKVEAEGVRDAQMIITEGLNPMIIQFMSIEAFEKLAESDNTKVIITDGKSPFLIEQ
ncbi:MAG: prohibitin family protein [Chitinophagales bacterium]|nr:prohibitin family protein [Chitinophagales bacterium]MCB9021945.1 prohibitin family protein [Chitinophagales bacterium]MCB9030803.1 prohibitin family protein [Chitinophagales bacterium]HQU77495.1 prohibitin family protein [Chitinophagales bacterium]HRX23567.1 prohibitin family protein [Chitinophagales bacterium]